eukprot:CAMPEP_0206369878 /NCGR_PEP_ID=MMETSP0294-20121207/5566_1 /ASSEMBLY_ACC=CAM_ASM_000327 /TAXON_ID=39354 /ORGANISM="Heterosigma akashiwo, Strain CCMP2393" /LENGTH=91 /DNA_ID=CAMNT_0053816731 /DNA_START=58 /DNA_END=330 /DNA_ORIENTATION=+
MPAYPSPVLFYHPASSASPRLSSVRSIFKEEGRQAGGGPSGSAHRRDPSPSAARHVARNRRWPWAYTSHSGQSVAFSRATSSGAAAAAAAA